MIKKVNSTRTSSPIKSPLRAPMRPVSPIRCSPFLKQAPLSPIKVRITMNGSKTPTRARENKRVELTRSPLNNIQNYETSGMHRTVKNGVGLFQQLAHQIKIDSQKKQNKLISYNTTNPFEYSEKKKQLLGNYSKSSFAALIQNVKQIESIQASKANYFNNQLSFKNQQKPRYNETTVKNEQFLKLKTPDPQPLNVIQSFQSPHTGRKQQNNVMKQQCKKLQRKAEPEYKIEVQPIEPVESEKKQVLTSSFQDVILLIKKASEKVKDQSSVSQQEVKMSIEENRFSFNMNPFF